MRHLRCTRATFLLIAANVTETWPRVHPALHHSNTGLTIASHVPSTTLSTPTETIALPTTDTEWEAIRLGFEVYGFPNAYGAIGGSLIAVKRFENFTGWYCRKGFAAFNMQAVVDHRLRFMSYSLRSGSQNDKSLFNTSKFGRVCHQRVPLGGCFLGDAGYKLEEAHYNTVHSRSRMPVERAFGRWKNKFREFKSELVQHQPSDMARLIEMSLLCHNWFIDYEDYPDELDLELFPAWMHIGGDFPMKIQIK
ncbi:hypothetical protein ACHHYP_20474 [Achlya hypogyna]|uniref:DDE Tnp4 domain-containing protein n=1 Tax=Achlya hypogyna TaxID=1202772 RepID=A0A1V9YLH5_ACHHY|nr:hypothetical protein ACHHYP_20474 [Achlya hypogyna]